MTKQTKKVKDAINKVGENYGNAIKALGADLPKQGLTKCNRADCICHQGANYECPTPTEQPKEAWEENIEKEIEKFLHLHYEPEHHEEATTDNVCWCHTETKIIDGKVHIQHQEQRVILADLLRVALTNIASLAEREALTEVHNELLLWEAQLGLQGLGATERFQAIDDVAKYVSSRLSRETNN